MISVDLVPVDLSCNLPSCGLEAGPLWGTSHRTVGGGQSSGDVPRSYTLLSYAQLNFIHRRHSPPSAAGWSSKGQSRAFAEYYAEVGSAPVRGPPRVRGGDPELRSPDDGYEPGRSSKRATDGSRDLEKQEIGSVVGRPIRSGFRAGGLWRGRRRAGGAARAGGAGGRRRGRLLDRGRAPVRSHPRAPVRTKKGPENIHWQRDRRSPAPNPARGICHRTRPLLKTCKEMVSNVLRSRASVQEESRPLGPGLWARDRPSGVSIGGPQ